MLAAHGEMKEDEPGKVLVQSAALCQLLVLKKAHSATASLKRWRRRDCTHWSLAKSSWSASLSEQLGGELIAKKVRIGTAEKGSHPDFRCVWSSSSRLRHNPDGIQAWWGFWGDANSAAGRRGPHASGGCAGTVTCWCWNISLLPPVSCKLMEGGWSDALEVSATSKHSIVQLCLLMLPFPVLGLILSTPLYKPSCALGIEGNLPSCPGAWLLNYIKGQ